MADDFDYLSFADDEYERAYGRKATGSNPQPRVGDLDDPPPDVTCPHCNQVQWWMTAARHIQFCVHEQQRRMRIAEFRMRNSRRSE